MLNKKELRKLIANIVNGNANSNCRLCLQEIEDGYVCFDDFVLLEPKESLPRPLSQLLAKHFGDEICNEIQGVDCVCTDCVEKVLQWSNFLNKCSKNHETLSQVCDNLSLGLDRNFSNNTQKIFLDISNDNFKLVEMTKKRKTSNYSCLDCYDVFSSFSELNDHSLVVHESIVCEKCSHTMKKGESDAHECPKGYCCDLCKCLFKSKNAISSHIDKQHTKYICSHCGESFNGSENLSSHERTTHKPKHECPNCKKTYLTESTFKNHKDLCAKGLIELHPRRSEIKRDLACKKCDKRYSTQGGLRVHERFAHGNAKPHICEHCGKKFIAPSCLKTHMVTHTKERNFECTICGHRLVSKEALLYHTRRHNGEKPYSCKICSESFVNASARAEHIKYKHLEPKECTVCHKKFTDQAYLQKHTKKHYDRTSKLYVGRSFMPANVPSIENMRVKDEDLSEWGGS